MGHGLELFFFIMTQGNRGIVDVEKLLSQIKLGSFEFVSRFAGKSIFHVLVWIHVIKFLFLDEAFSTPIWSKFSQLFHQPSLERYASIAISTHRIRIEL